MSQDARHPTEEYAVQMTAYGAVVPTTRQGGGAPLVKERPALPLPSLYWQGHSYERPGTDCLAGCWGPLAATCGAKNPLSLGAGTWGH